MSSGYDLLIQAQCSESMERLDLESVQNALETVERFDVKSRLCERIAFLIYQDSNFGLLATPSKSIESVSSCINRLCKSITSFPIENETFVGPCTSSSSDPEDSQLSTQNSSNHSKERILCALLLTTPKKDLPALLSSSSSLTFTYPSTASFAQKLLDNDERFLTSMLALLPLIEELETSSIFHPVAVFLESMHIISYDCEVLIDWINSELAASSLILRVLKSNCHERTKKIWMDYEPKKTSQSSTITTFRDEPIPCKPMISLKIIEVIGDQKMTKTVQLIDQKFQKIPVKKPNILKNSGKFKKWIEMVLELRTRLRRLLAAKLVAGKLNLILKWTDRFCDIFVENSR